MITLLLPILALAGPLTDKAYQVAAQLGANEGRLTQTQSASVARDLDRLLATLSGQPSDDIAYFCTSRDNDNSRPFVLAYKNFANVVRIPSAVYNSKEDCESSIAAAQRSNGNFYACATRDNDGNRPFKIVAVNAVSPAIALQRSVLGSLEDCLASTRAMKIRPEGLLYCGTRDNDGNRPFTQTGLRNDGTFVPSREEYNTLNECTSAL